MLKNFSRCSQVVSGRISSGSLQECHLTSTFDSLKMVNILWPYESNLVSIQTGFIGFYVGKSSIWRSVICRPFAWIGILIFDSDISSNLYWDICIQSKDIWVPRIRHVRLNLDGFIFKGHAWIFHQLSFLFEEWICSLKIDNNPW